MVTPADLASSHAHLDELEFLLFRLFLFLSFVLWLLRHLSYDCGAHQATAKVRARVDDFRWL